MKYYVKSYILTDKINSVLSLKANYNCGSYVNCSRLDKIQTKGKKMNFIQNKTHASLPKLLFPLGGQSCEST